MKEADRPVNISQKVGATGIEKQIFWKSGMESQVLKLNQYTITYESFFSCSKFGK